MRRSLTHPVLLAATALLLLNDHVWKAAYGNALTGKLSDVAGLLAFAWCAAAVLPRRRWARVLAFAGTGAGFAWFKSAAADGFLAWWSAWCYPIARVVDPTDLVALLVLPLGYAYFSRVDARSAAVPGPSGASWGLAPKLVTLVACVVAFAATSVDDGDWGPREEVWVAVEAADLDAEYVVLRAAQDILAAHLSPEGRTDDDVDLGECFSARFAVTPPEGFTSLAIATESRLTPTADSSVFAFTAIRSYEAAIDTGFYGALSWEVVEQAEADLSELSPEDALALLELDVVTRLRLDAALLPLQSAPTGTTPEREVFIWPCP